MGSAGAIRSAVLLVSVLAAPAHAQVPPRIDPRPVPSAAVELCLLGLETGVLALRDELLRLEWNLDERTIAVVGAAVTILRAGEFDWRGAHTLQVEFVQYPTVTEAYCSFQTDQWTPEAGVDLSVVAGYGMAGRIDPIVDGPEEGFFGAWQMPRGGGVLLVSALHTGDQFRLQMSGLAAR